MAPRVHKLDIYKYFRYHDVNYVQCKECCQLLKKDRTFNLKKHLMHLHKIHLYSQTIIWRPKGMRALINYYEEHDNMYNPQHVQYNNKQIQADSLRQLQLKMRSFHEGITEMEVKTKIAALRSQYIANLQKEAEYRKNGGTGTCEKMPPYLKHLKFLNPFLKINVESSSTLAVKLPEPIVYESDNSKHHESDSEVVSNATLSNLSTNVPEASPTDNVFVTGREDLASVSNKRRSFKADVETFGEYIKVEMDQIEDPKKRRAMRYKIMKVFMGEI
ncbi:uncharacterized protein LOC116805692 isoform X2 [Drosophila grimshawi]|uniref:uncharacterized protein LOC116805692 isoform X2 n=1 Tax=Drosophila grimshawi TaxID=7222 RepID=UPI0013EF2495|nr:uncharacterized protein LOC116805692 isoform X2 [Drosophila grimshawi]